MKTKITIALTGHRPDKLAGYKINDPFYVRLQERLEAVIREYLGAYDIIQCHSGLALGADTVWSKAILQMRQEYPDRVKFHADIPMEEQPSVWFNKSDVEFWHEQVKQADSKTVYGSLEEYPESQRKYMAVRLLEDRNQGMLSPADIVIAIFNGNKKGGTANAVRFAKQQSKQLIIIDPKNI